MHYLKLIWAGLSFGQQAIRLDWSNDRHQEVNIPHDASPSDVAGALRRLAYMVENDTDLQDEY